MSYKPLDDNKAIEQEEEENLLITPISPQSLDVQLDGQAEPERDENGKRKYIIQEEEDEDDDEYFNFRVQAQRKGFKAIRYALVVLTFVLLAGFLVAAIVLIALTPSCKVNDLEWWKTTVIYQCYPRSFKDSSGDGDGDLQGIISKVDYLHGLGVGTIWLNPIFKSPRKDNGYDISNYTEIDGLYGSMEDLKQLLSLLHSKGMQLILDFVPNHTSDEHEWFKESRSSNGNPKRDWYVWANPGDDGGPPNNWLSLFGGSAWSFDDDTRQYYLHQFAEFQPDLNYQNPDVQQAMKDVIKFWLDLGVDGFRVDAVIFLLEDSKFQSEPDDPTFVDKFNCSAENNTNRECYNSLNHTHTKDITGIHDIIKSWRNLTDSYTDTPRFMVGETYDPVNTVMKYYGTNNDEFNFPFNFLLLSNKEWTGDSVSHAVSQWMDAMPEGAWPNWVLGNHDNPRIANSAGTYLARALNVLLLTLPGTPTTYYGEEIFMTDVYVPPARRNDIYQDRDKERTPMQWDTSANAGFTSKNVTPWLPVATNYTIYNVEVESSNSSSMLSLYKRVVKLVTTQDAFRFAEYEEVMSNSDLFAYHRFHNGTRNEYVVVVNFSQKNTTASLDSIKDQFQDSVVELSSAGTNRDGTNVDLNKILMGPGEALVINGCSSGNC